MGLKELCEITPVDEPIIKNQGMEKAGGIHSRSKGFQKSNGGIVAKKKMKELMRCRKISVIILKSPYITVIFLELKCSC